MDTKKRGRGNRMNWKTETDIYTPLCIKQITVEHATVQPKRRYSALCGDRSEGKSRKRDICIVNLIHFAAAETTQHGKAKCNVIQTDSK